jgi:hypothetical protein
VCYRAPLCASRGTTTPQIDAPEVQMLQPLAKTHRIRQSASVLRTWTDVQPVGQALSINYAGGAPERAPAHESCGPLAHHAPRVRGVYYAVVPQPRGRVVGGPLAVVSRGNGLLERRRLLGRPGLAGARALLLLDLWCVCVCVCACARAPNCISGCKTSGSILVRGGSCLPACRSAGGMSRQAGKLQGVRQRLDAKCRRPRDDRATPTPAARAPPAPAPPRPGLLPSR